MKNLSEVLPSKVEWFPMSIDLCWEKIQTICQFSWVVVIIQCFHVFYRGVSVPRKVSIENLKSVLLITLIWSILISLYPVDL